MKIVANKIADRDYEKNTKPIFSGDIGCYGLGYLPPLEAIDSAICMGGSIGLANGYAHAIHAPIIAIIGDSTFLHGGIPGLINAVYNNAKIMVAILDNETTAMTGFQPHPGTGFTATGLTTNKVSIEELARSCGVTFVQVVDPNKLGESRKVVEKALEYEGPSVVIFRRRCELLEVRDKRRRREKIVSFSINAEKCSQCGICMTHLGCPAIIKSGEMFTIDSFLCSGCSICAQICPCQAIGGREKC